jgi:predicted TIM-barrel fold metal-dependent hydrolase
MYMFDSNVHVCKNSLLHLRSISLKIKKHGITKPLFMFDNEKSFNDRKVFFNNCLKTNNLIPVATIRNVRTLKYEIQDIKKTGFKFIKFHPRNLNIKFGDDFYVKAFMLLKKTKLNIMWCTFDGWTKNNLSEVNQLEFISRLANIIDNNKIILMHSGGPNILKYYEKFRFSENIFFDLSYTISHYENTSIEKDIIFLFKKFHKRIIVGCDYPAINFQVHKSSQLSY